MEYHLSLSYFFRTSASASVTNYRHARSSVLLSTSSYNSFSILFTLFLLTLYRRLLEEKNIPNLRHIISPQPGGLEVVGGVGGGDNKVVSEVLEVLEVVGGGGATVTRDKYISATPSLIQTIPAHPSSHGSMTQL